MTMYKSSVNEYNPYKLIHINIHSHKSLAGKQLAKGRAPEHPAAWLVDLASQKLHADQTAHRATAASQNGWALLEEQKTSILRSERPATISTGIVSC